MIIPDSYELIEKREMLDVASIGYLISHKKTGARVFVMENDDDNKVFSIGFRTTPTNSTGVAHIIEHTVLCGSEKYPAKDPFVELVKGSLNTFLNAMTYPDKTVFPVASCNDKDFQNLMSVYMDAVFHPNIYHNKMLFEQEGWHYELADSEAPLIYNGVVYNEMKGAYSSADDILAEYISRALYPDTEYANDSGGFPGDIPNLTYEEFLDFHRRYYHPSNSYTFLYGNADMAEKLEWIDKEYFGKYDKIDIDSMPAYQDSFNAAADVRGVYGITEDENEENNTYLAWARVIGDTSDAESCAAYGILGSVLLDAPGAPLKQALIDAGIGEEIFGGYADSMRQPHFMVAAKGANESQKEEFVRVVEDTLKSLAENGINKKSLRAALNVQEFSTKEADFGNYPKGLIYGLDTYGYWLYDDRAVFDNLELDRIFTSLRAKIETDYFEQIIKIMLLNNTHGATVVLAPERGYNEKQEKLLADKLAGIKASMSDEEIESIVKHTEELKIFQNTPSTADELEMIPMLGIDDVGKEAMKLSNIETEISGIKTIKHDYFTSGIAYTAFSFDIQGFGLEDIPYLQLLCNFMSNVNTEHFSYQELGDELRIKTGSFTCDLNCYTRDNELKATADITVKMLKEQMGPALELVREIILSSDYTDTKRIRELLAETKSKLSGLIMERGHSFASMRCGSYYSEKYYIDDLKGGVAFYSFVEDLLKDYDNKATMLISKLTDLSKKLINKKNMLISITGKQDIVDSFAGEMSRILDSLPVFDYEKQVWDIKLEAKNEGFKTGAQVNYVSRCGNYKLIDENLKHNGHFNVLSVWMSYEYLWVNVRVKGGAYGCFSSYSRKGDVSMTSFRDPNVAATSEIFMNAAENIKKIDFSQRDLTKYILGAINSMDTPLSPGRKGSLAMAAYCSNISDESMQKSRDEVLSTTIEDLRACADKIDIAMKQGYVCAVGNASKIEEDKDLFKEVMPLFH